MDNWWIYALAGAVFVVALWYGLNKSDVHIDSDDYSD